MPESQPETKQPADRSTRPEPLGPAPDSVDAADDRPTGPPAAALAPHEAAADPAAGGAPGPDATGGALGSGPVGGPARTAVTDNDDPKAAAVAARWSGSAPVPPPPIRKRRWLETLVDDVPAPQPWDPAPASSEDREEMESRTPVDPWAGADLWGPHAVPYPPVESYQPTRPYTIEQPLSPPPAPAPPAGPPARPPAAPPEPVRKPAKPSKRGRRGRPAPLAYGPPPPGWQPPPGYVAVAVRRRRRWPWIVLLLTVTCCCGCPAYFGGPMLQQYPATAALPAQVADLTLREDSASERVAQRLEQDLRANYWTEDTFAGVYSTANQKRVIIFGATGFRLSPDKDVDAEISRLTPAYDITGIRSMETGVRGEYQRCGTGRANDTDVVVCTWADHGSLATGVFTRLSVQDSAKLLGKLRTSIVTRG